MSRAAPTGAAPKRRSSLVLALVGVLVLAGGGLGYQWYAATSTRAAEREQLLADVGAEVAKRPPNGDELSRLMARIQKQADRDSARELITAAARIELARGRVARAIELFAPIGGQPGAAPAEQRFAAQLGLLHHAAGLQDRATAVTVLEQVIAGAESAYGDGQSADDLGLAWLAANRLPDAARAARFAERLRAEHAGSPFARLAELAGDFRLDLPINELLSLQGKFDVPPPELLAMQVLLQLQGGDLGAAVASLEPVLAAAPGVLAVRWAAALVFHACALGQPAGSDARRGWVDRRDAQLDWMLAQAAPDDERRPQWATMREQR